MYTHRSRLIPTHTHTKHMNTYLPPIFITHRTGRYWDYCTQPPQPPVTQSGCACKRKWTFPPSEPGALTSVHSTLLPTSISDAIRGALDALTSGSETASNAHLLAVVVAVAVAATTGQVVLEVVQACQQAQPQAPSAQQRPKNSWVHVAGPTTTPRVTGVW